METTVSLDFSIVIPAYNEEELLPATLDNIGQVIAQIESHRGEIVVVDNNSTDRTGQIANAAGVRLVFEEHRQIARARNAGAREALGHYLFFVDADTRIDVPLLRKSLALLDSGDYCGGGATVKPDAPVNIWARGALCFWLGLSKTFTWACGAYVFCLRQAFDEIGGFDERFYASEEIHFSRALKKWGRRNQRRMCIIDEPIVTSMRKLRWYSPSRLAKVFLIFALRPGMVKDRERCWLWYERPPAREKQSDSS